MGEYLVSGATLKCTNGAAPSKLLVTIPHGVYAGGKPIANMMDFAPIVNILPFGTCKMIPTPAGPGPCIPATCMPWLKFHPKALIGTFNALTTDSMLICPLGGIIKPKNSGQ